MGTKIEPNSIAHVGRDKHAVDFLVPEGTPICAPRDGVVVAVKNDSDRGGPDEAFANDANYIVIRHTNSYTLMGDSREEWRTMEQPDDHSILIHLAKDSALVKVGDKVMTGQIIARQGSTGWTYDPHIHYAVYRHGTSIPISFEHCFGSI